MQYAKSIILLSISLLLILAGCSEQVSTTEELSVRDMSDKISCTNYTTGDDGNDYQKVIRTQEEYQALNETSGCDYPLPDINLSDRVLVGDNAFGGGCSVDFNQSAYKNEQNNSITYLITVREEGNCDMARGGMQWAIIENVSSDYSVTFEQKSS